MIIREYSTLERCYYYANLFNGMPPNGTPQDADCAVALSFGRNSIPDAILPILTKIYREYEGASDIRMIKRIIRITFQPGKPNTDIADFVGYLLNVLHKPITVQWEIGVTLGLLKGIEFVEKALEEKQLFIVWPFLGATSLPSRNVLRQSYQMMGEDLYFPLLLAHDLHMPRVYLLACETYKNPIVSFRTITRAFDSQSVQDCARSPMRCHWYEFRARAHHLWHGWVNLW